jgi:hypothetical protein
VRWTVYIYGREVYRETKAEFLTQSRKGHAKIAKKFTALLCDLRTGLGVFALKLCVMAPVNVHPPLIV